MVILRPCILKLLNVISSPIAFSGSLFAMFVGVLLAMLGIAMAIYLILVLLPQSSGQQ